jgi:hypothetical protein
MMVQKQLVTAEMAKTRHPKKFSDNTKTVLNQLLTKGVADFRTAVIFVKLLTVASDSPRYVAAWGGRK